MNITDLTSNAAEKVAWAVDESGGNRDMMTRPCGKNTKEEPRFKTTAGNDDNSTSSNSAKAEASHHRHSKGDVVDCIVKSNVKAMTQPPSEENSKGPDVAVATSNESLPVSSHPSARMDNGKKKACIY